MFRTTATTGLATLAMVLTGCAAPPPQTGAILAYMRSDAAYAALPSGPQRVDALYLRARELTGSNTGAIDLLGTLAVDEGVKLKHPFNTGLTETGALARRDRTGHFFAHAMWRYHDHHRLIPVAESNGFFWEVLGEMKSWFTSGDGYDRRDIWANRLGREFGDRVHECRDDPGAVLLPSDTIARAERFRPAKVPPEPATTAAEVAVRAPRGEPSPAPRASAP